MQTLGPGNLELMCLRVSQKTQPARTFGQQEDLNKPSN